MAIQQVWCKLRERQMKINGGLSLRGEEQAGDRCSKQECVVWERKSKIGVLDVGLEECASRRGLVVHDKNVDEGCIKEGEV